VLPHHTQSPRAKSSAVGRTYSVSSSENGLHPPAPVRKSSVPDSMLGGRRSLDSTTYPPISPKRISVPAQAPSRSHSMHTPTNHATALNGTPSKPLAQYSSLNDMSNNSNNNPTSSIDPSFAPPKLTNRQSLGSRKRKPVPAYDPNQDPSSPVSPAAASQHVPPHPSSPSPISPNPNPTPSPDSSRPDTATANGGCAHYTTRSQLEQKQQQQDQSGQHPVLAHKSSFGPGGVEGKPLHYLIPDMPMPVQD
jgi:hypothetical protein